MQMKEVVRKLIYWSLPAGIHGAWRRWKRYQRRRSILDAETRAVLRKNRVLENAHDGERCFILGTGPSINKMDLSHLQTETAIALNSFFLHEDYREICPTYHAYSGLAPHRKIMTDELGLEWYQELEESTAGITLLLNYLDREFIQGHRLLQEHTVFYFQYSEDWKLLSHAHKGIDATQLLFPGKNVAVMAIQIAVYMGCKEIYLLGMDHDWLVRHMLDLNTHFYNDEKDALTEHGKRVHWNTIDWSGEFNLHYKLWRQYEALNQYAEDMSIDIFNVTPGGILDVFERVDYEALFDRVTPVGGECEKVKA